jgi:hypothetical protein
VSLSLVAKRRRQTLLTAAVEAEAQALLLIATTLVRLIKALWHLLTDPYDRGQVDTFVRHAGAAVQQARTLAAGVSDAYMRQALDIIEVPSAGRPEPVPDLPRGIPMTSEMVRPIKEYRRARLLGLDQLLADDRALARAEKIVTMDVYLASRDARMNRLVLAEDVIGWRRVVHPEVPAVEGHAPGPVCGLCLAAADRVYHKIEKQALHDRCRCTIAPVTATQDIGSPLNNASLTAIYAHAGGTDRQSLARQRYRIENHGELGPVLVNAADNFRGPGDVRVSAPELVQQARVELASVRAALEELLGRQAAGDEDVSAPIAWQQDRLTALRELTGEVGAA